MQNSEHLALARIKVTRRLLGMAATADKDAVVERVSRAVGAAVGRPDALLALRTVWGIPATKSSTELITATRGAFDVLEQERARRLSFAPTVPVPSSSQPTSRTTPQGSSTTIDLTGLAGRNRTERLLSWIKANEPGADKLSWTQLNQRAHELAQKRVIVDGVTAPVGARAHLRTLVHDQASSTPVAGQRRTINLVGCDGRNRTERILFWIRANEPGFAGMGWLALNRRAHELARTSTIHDPYATAHA